MPGSRAELTASDIDTALGTTPGAVRGVFDDAGEEVSQAFADQVGRKLSVPLSMGNHYCPAYEDSSLAPYRVEVDDNGVSINPARDIARAQQWLAATAAAKTRWIAALENGDRHATFGFGQGDWPVMTAPVVMANYITEYGWSRHGVDFDFGSTEVDGGRIVADGARLIRIENDPGTVTTGDVSLNSNNSTILLRGKSRGLHIEELDMEGFQVDTQSVGVRGITSGDGLQVSFGVQGLEIDTIRGWKGTNAAFCLGLNKRGAGATANAPLGGYDTSVDQMVKHVRIKHAYTWNGEHGGLTYMCEDVTISEMIIRQKPYTFAGVARSDYQQRGLYVLGTKDLVVDLLDIGGVPHVGLFLVVYSDHRCPTDLSAQFGRVIGNYDGLLDDDPDRYAFIEFQDNNSDVVGKRRISVDIGSIDTRGKKTAMIWRDGDNYVDEVTPTLTRLNVGRINTKTVVHGVYLKPFSGGGDIHIGAGAIKCRKDTNVSAGLVPLDGLTIQAGARIDRRVAQANPVTLATLATYAYWPAARPTDLLVPYIEPRNIKHVTDWPGGARTVVYDPFTGGEGSSGWRPLQEPGYFDSVTIGNLCVEASSQPGRIGGVKRLVMNAPDFRYVSDGGEAEEARCLLLDEIDGCGFLSYGTSDGLAARQEYAGTVQVPAPLWRKFHRTFTRDLSSISANSASAYFDIVVTGVKAGDIVVITPKGDISNLTVRGYANVDNNVRVKVLNPTSAAIDPVSMDFAITTEAALS